MHAPSYAEVSRFASASSYSVDFRDVVTENCLAFQYGPTSSQCSVCSAGDCTSEAVASATFDQLLLPAATECLRAVKYPDGEPRDQPLNDGNEACQTLGNLCALAMYEADAAACQLFQQVALEQSSFVNQEDQWKMRMPWLYYSSGPLPYSIDNVDLRFRFHEHSHTLCKSTLCRNHYRGHTIHVRFHILGPLLESLGHLLLVLWCCLDYDVDISTTLEQI